MAAYFSYNGFFALFFFSACFLTVTYRAVQNRRLYPIDYSAIFIAIVYGLSFPMVVDSVENGNYSVFYNAFQPFRDYYFINTVAASMALAGLFWGWNTFKQPRYIVDDGQYRTAGLFSKISNPKVYEVAFWTMLVIAILTMFLYTLDYGGFANATKYSDLVRSSYFQAFRLSRFSFLQPFGDFAALACYGFLGLIMSKRASFTNILGFSAAFAFYLYVLLLKQGRLDVVIFLSIIALCAAHRYRLNATLLAILLLFVAPASIYGLYLLSNLLDLKGSNGFEDFYLREISFVFAAFFSAMSEPAKTFRVFYDVVTYPLYLIPSSLSLNWLDDPSYTITAIVHGARKGLRGVSSGIPVDIVTMGLLQLNFFGIIPYAFFYGMVLRMFHKVGESIPLAGVSTVFSVYVCVKLSGVAMFYAQPQHVVLNNFPMIVSLIAVALLSVIKKGRGPLARRTTA